MQGASTLRIKREEKPLSWNVWAPTWAELCEVIMSNDGLQPSTAHGPSNEQEHVAPERQGGWGHQQGRLSLFSLPLLKNVPSWLLRFVVLVSLPTDLLSPVSFCSGRKSLCSEIITGHSRSFTRGTFLVFQWLRLCLQCRGPGFDS